ncbi:MAG: dienelactone hydrolase family protein [Bacteroidota bacterium]
MKSIFLFLIFLGLSHMSLSQIHMENFEYKIGDSVFEGYLAYDASIKDKHPGVLIVHEWWGITPYIQKRAEQLARLGYVAFAVDIYGKGIRAKTPEEAQTVVKQFYGDRKLLRQRAAAGLDILRKNSLVDPKRIAAIGYCFGGMTALELARSGADIAGVVSFHGGLATPNTDDAKNIKAKILVLTGGDDPNVPATQVTAFEDEMRKANVDWQLVSYGGAVHSFTNPASGNDPAKGVAYNEKADKRSWDAMKTFFSEIFQ